MTIDQSKLGRIRLAPEVSWGTEVSIGSFLEFPWREDDGATITVERPLESPMRAQQSLDGQSVSVLMAKRVTIEFTTNLCTFDTKALSTVAATSHWLVKLLQGAGFGALLSTGTTVSGTSSTVNVVNFTSASTYRAGGAYAVKNATTGLFEAREIKSIATNAVTPKFAHSAAPVTAGWDIMGCASVFLDGRPGIEPTYLQFAAEGASPYDRWLVKGCVLDSLTIDSLGPNQIPRLKWKFKGRLWNHPNGTDTTMNLIGAVLGRATYINAVTLVTKDSELRFGTVGTTTIAPALHAAKIEIANNLQFAELPTPGGTETIFGYRRTRADGPSFTATLSVPLEDLTYFAMRDARSSHRVAYQIGTAASVGGCLFSLRTLQMMDTKRDDQPVGGVQYQTFPLAARDDEETTKSATAGTADAALEYAPVAFHFF